MLRRLRRGRAAFAVLGLLVAGGCAKPAPSPSPLVQVESPRVVLAPVSFDQHVSESLEPGLPVLRERIAAYLTGRGCRVEQPSFTEFEDLWHATDKGESLYDADGTPTAAYDAAIGRLIASLDARERFDALVIPYLLLRTARVRGQTGVWDDSKEKLEPVYEHKDRFQVEAVGMELPATSLRVLVYAEDGTRLHEDTQGLELAAKMVIKNSSYWTLVAREDLFQDPKELDEEVRQALAPVFE